MMSDLHRSAIDDYARKGWRLRGYRRCAAGLLRTFPEIEDDPDSPENLDLHFGRIIPDAYRVMQQDNGRIVVQCVEVENLHRVEYSQLREYADAWFNLDCRWSPDADLDMELYVHSVRSGVIHWVDLLEAWNGFFLKDKRCVPLVDCGVLVAEAGRRPTPLPSLSQCTLKLKQEPRKQQLPKDTPCRSRYRLDSRRREAPWTLDVVCSQTGATRSLVADLIDRGILPVVPESIGRDIRVYSSTAIRVIPPLVRSAA